MDAVGKGFNKALNVFGLGVPDMPEVEDPKTAPVADDEKRRLAAERSAQRKRRGKGRAGTVLDESSNLG